MLFASNEDRGWRRCGAATGDGIREGGGQFDDGEDGVESTVARREFKLVRSFANLTFDSERAEATVSEFGGRSRGFNVTVVKPDSIYGLEVGGWGASSVVVEGIFGFGLFLCRLCLR